MYVADIHDLLRQLGREGFYGVVEIRFESGRISVVKKTESLKVAGQEPERSNREVRDDRKPR